METLFKVLGSLTICLSVGVRLPAEEPVRSTDEAQIARWVKQLDDDDFAVREAATKSLTEVGAAALPQLSEAVQSVSLEASTRAFSILEKWLNAGQPLEKTAAHVLLTNLITSEKEGTVQRLAKGILANSSRRASEESDYVEFDWPPEVFLEDIVELEFPVDDMVGEVMFVEAPRAVILDPFGAEDAEPDAIWKDFIKSVEPPVLEVESLIELQLPNLEGTE